MIIKKIKITNFRGFEDKTIDFKSKPVVLLSAGNGIGKTSTIDAIEWCLTGEISRLKRAFDSRSSNDSERRQNRDGILKYRNADKNALTCVTLWLMDNKQEIVIRREQGDDVLDAKSSTVTIDESRDKAEKFLNEYVGDSFYNFHFCDVQKAFSIQNTKRKDLKSFFDEFITNYDSQKRIADNIDLFADDVGRYIDDLKNKKVTKEKIDIERQRIEELKEKIIPVSYPEVYFYSKENIKIEELDKAGLEGQRKKIQNCGYLIVKKKLSILIENNVKKEKLLLLNKIIALYKDNEVCIQYAIIKKLYSYNSIMESVKFNESKLEELKRINITKETVIAIGKDIIKDYNDDSLSKVIEDKEKIIRDKEKQINALEVDVNSLTKGNRIIQLLSNLYANKDLLVRYRNKALECKYNVKCPVCGSSTFATINENSILSEANEYIEQNGKVVKEKENKKANLQQEITKIYNELLDEVRSYIKGKIGVLEKEVNRLRKISKDLKEYFEVLANLEKLGYKLRIDESTDENIINNFRSSLLSELLEDSKETEEKETYHKILTVIGYIDKNESLEQTYEKIKNRISEEFEINNFSLEVFISKINVIDSMIYNKDLEDLNLKLTQYEEENKKIDKEIEELNNLKKYAEEKAKNIKEVVDNLSKAEYENIGPTLSRFYNKLIRINNIGKIHINYEKEGISLTDEKGKNIVNVLSDGQISVFIIAYFFAGINVRNEREKIKIFFMDDLTSCMDDVNMLAFIDLLKYQMSAKMTMDQLFFVTCDERISTLIKYKMSGHEIDLREISELDFM